MAYVLARGAAVGWYPYPFLDPRRAGHGSVALHVVAIVALFLVVQWGTAASARSVVSGRNTIYGRGRHP